METDSDLVQQRGRLGRQQTLESRHAGPVCCNAWILIMVSLGMGRGLSQGYRGSRPRPWPKVGAEVCTFRPRRAQAPGPIPKETMMRFYNQAHAFYCGVDLHARTMYLCILDQAGTIVLHQDLPAERASFLEAIAPYREGLVVACECLFCWYWLADLCQAEKIPFVLGHALYMKAIHGGKSKDDKIDSKKIALLLRGGNLPISYAYPQGLRETRDLLRRRMYLVHKRAEVVAHVVNTNSQYNLPPFGKKLIYARNRQALKIAERFADGSVRQNVALDLRLLDSLDELIGDVELYLDRTVKVDDADTFYRLRSIPGVGKILALVLFYEIHDIHRFASAGKFLSYARLIRPKKTSAGKVTGGGGAKIGNAHLKWAFSEAACLLARESDQAKRFLARKEKPHGKAKALGILAARLGRSVYHMLRQKKAFDPMRFWNGEPGVTPARLQKSAVKRPGRAKGSRCVLEA
jgi:transposase